MNPVALRINPKLAIEFHREAVPALAKEHLRHLIVNISPRPHTRIVLVPGIKDESEIKPILKVLENAGIPRRHVWIQFGKHGETDSIEEILESKGLSGSGLTFGPDVAEKDDGLSRYFLVTPSYNRIASRERHIVVGPKGAGKSAILKELAENQTRVLVITPEHYATDILHSIQGSQLPNELGAFVTTWKYSIIVEIFRELVSKGSRGSPAISRIRSFMISHGHMRSNLTLVERFLGYLRRISQVGAKLGPVGGDVELHHSEELEKLFKLSELLELIPTLQTVLRHTPYFVYVDELDQSWDNSPVANRFLISLLTAAIQLRSLDPNLHVVVFLRSEIFDLLKPHLPQLDKLRSDIENLTWNTRELTHLIASRIADSVGLAGGEYTAEYLIRTVFRGRIQDSDMDSFAYILSRTSYRPREVIQFCNLALEAAIPLDSPAIPPEAVLRAEEVFSTWKAEHVVAENMYIYPGLDAILEFFRGKTRRLKAEAFDGLLSDIILRHIDHREEIPWLDVYLEPTALMKLLYQLEVVGIERLAREPELSRNPWETYDFAFARPKGKVEDSATFLFHPGLWRALELI